MARSATRLFGRVVGVVAGLGAGYLAYLYLSLPDVRPLKTTNPATTAFIELRAREAEAKGTVPRRVQRWVPYNQMSASLKRAVLVTEDSAFWQHEGIDLEQIKESFERNLQTGAIARGGSTITQQLAKNLYLSPSKNPLRKLRELLIARRLEVELSKRRILEIYLNVIEWGDGIYGADAASRAYFRVPASALGPEQSALMAGAIRNPRLLDPAHPSKRLAWLQRLILRRMGAVTPPENTPPENAPPESTPAPTLPPIEDEPVVESPSKEPGGEPR